jgi:hypothetical protein
MRAVSKIHWRRNARRVACLIVLGALLAGCDSCGDWRWSFQSEACRQQPPKPQ